MSAMNRLIGGLLGLAGGVAGLAAMNYAMKLAAKVGLAAREPENEEPPESPPAQPKRSMSLVGTHHFPGEKPPAAVGRIAYEKLRGERPGPLTREMLGNSVHLGYGLIMAGLYGLVRAGRRDADLIGGLAFALGLFIVGDELVVPLLGLSDAPTETPMREHGKFLVGHLAYGLATAAATQGLSAGLGKLKN